MADVQPTADPNTVTQKNPTSESDEKGTPTRKKSSVATANVKRKPSFVEKVRRSTTLENISNNIGSTDIGVDDRAKLNKSKQRRAAGLSRYKQRRAHSRQAEQNLPNLIEA